MLSEEETKQIKQEIIKQVETTFPAEKIELVRNQIESMNSEQLEEFLEKNKMIKQEGANQCVFCSIVSENIKSCKIDENEDAIAVFEINPVSKAHILIISKEHTENPTKKSLSLADKISKKIKKKLKPKDIQIANSKSFGHSVINIIPVYKDENINSKRNSTTLEELEKIKAELEEEPVKPVKIKKPKIEQIKEKLWLPKRIP